MCSYRAHVCVESLLVLSLIGGAVVGGTHNKEREIQHTLVREYVFSKWYCLDFGLGSHSAGLCSDDSSKLSTEISGSLSSKLSVPASGINHFLNMLL